MAHSRREFVRSVAMAAPLLLAGPRLIRALYVRPPTCDTRLMHVIDLSKGTLNDLIAASYGREFWEARQGDSIRVRMWEREQVVQRNPHHGEQCTGCSRGHLRFRRGGGGGLATEDVEVRLVRVVHLPKVHLPARELDARVRELVVLNGLGGLEVRLV
jgi:hypothetical protein